jgi:NodT family efflux transporter outer membrane factor (OMF) lipoprotein
MDEGISLQSTYKAAPKGKQNITKDEDHQDIYNNVQWWALYDDPDLDGLVTHAFSNSPSLGQIRARLKQAEALKDKFSSALWPSLNVSTKRNTYNGSTNTYSDFDLTGAASYEVDLWGKNRATSDSYALKEQASREDLHGAAITLSANIVDLWLKILALVEQETLLRKQIETNQTIYELMLNRFEMGSTNALDVLQQEEIVSASKAELPDILSSQAQAINALSLLIGEAPNNAITVHAKPLPEPLPIAKTSLPSTLMQNRPDIIAAWLRVLSNDKNARIAKANRLPSFDLSAVYAAGSTKFTDIFDTWLMTLAGELAVPIIDGGALAAEQRFQEALADESFHAYRETVLRAVGDVEDAIVTNHFQDEKIVALNDQLRAARETLEQAQISYANGQSTYINVLSSIKAVQSLERQIVSERLVQAQARVSLYRALGGQGWGDIVPSVTTLMNYPGKENPQTPALEGEKMETEQL